MASNHWPTYILICIYVLSMIVVTIIANKKNRKEQDKETKSSSHSSVVSTHFLASKNFGAVILLLTTFASVFSGNTIVGVPNESGKIGFISIRWLSLIMMIGLSLLIIFPRLRRLSIIRQYESPGEFINDRFNSKLLCILVTLSLCIPQLLYIAIQLYSLGAIISNFTDNELSFYAITVVASVLILTFEILGGIRSVAYTDAVQAIVMILIFISIPIVIGIQTYGGFIGQVVNSEDLPCNNSNKDATSGCLNYSNGFGEIDIEQFYLRTPSNITIINYLLFVISALSYSLNPHLLQRAMSARHDWQVQFVIICLFAAAFLCMIPGILYGITYISNYNDLKPEYQKFAAFQALLGVFRDQNGFVSFLSYMCVLAAIAAIMSTTDSALIGLSNTISCDIFKNWLLPNISLNKIVLIGKLTSFCTMAISICIAIYFYKTNADYAVIGLLRGAILWQAVPSYVLGLYTNISTKPVLFGIIIGLICDIILISMVYSNNESFIATDSSLVLSKSWSSLLGVLFNLFTCAIGHWLFCKSDDNNNKLSIEKIRQIMRGINEPTLKSRTGHEPITKYYGIFSRLIAIFVIITAFHWHGPIDPSLIKSFGEEKVKSLPYNGEITNVIAGFPQWAFATLIWCIVASISGIIAASLWTVNEQIQDKQYVPTDSNVSLQKLDTDTTETNVPLNTGSNA
eukprot:334359_1